MDSRESGYQSWLAGRGQYKEEHLRKFLARGQDHEEVIGLEVEALRSMFPFLVDRRDFPPQTYRGEFIARQNRARAIYYPGLEGDMLHLWFDANADDFGYCFVVINDIVVDFKLVKG